MYEHSYHIDYGAKAGDYVGSFMAAINWPLVQRFATTLVDNHDLRAGIAKLLRYTLSGINPSITEVKP